MTTRVRGRGPLSVPRGRRVRPTSERVRQSVFDILGQRCDGDRVLDLYAGTGALGIEAAARGAARVVFVEIDRHTAETVRRNAARLVEECDTRVLVDDVPLAVATLRGRGERFDLIFADPPYDRGEVARVMEALVRQPLLDERGVLVIEHSPRERPGDPGGVLRPVDERRYGQTMVSFFRTGVDEGIPEEREGEMA